MKIDRLIGIIMILLQRDKATVAELAERFEVSARTINRDVEDICKAGLPLVTVQGYRGGISFAEGYKIDKTFFTREELQSILTGLKGIDSISEEAYFFRLIDKLSDRGNRVEADDVITIDDDELIVAFLDMVENHKMIVENSGLLTVAALRHLNFTGKKVVSILSGGNMDVITMSSVVQHGLIQRDRIFTVSVLIPDKPGELVRVASIIAENQGNVIKLDHNQFISTNRYAAVELKVTLEAYGTDHKKKIVKALEEAGCKPKIIRANL